MTIFEESAKRYITSPSICTVQERVENTCRRDGFYEGAKWMLENAVFWLKEHAGEYVWYDEMARDCGLDDDFVDKFKKAMEG